MKIPLLLPIDPVPWQRARVSRSGHFVTEPKTRAFKSAIAIMLKLGFTAPLDGDLALQIHFYLTRPKTAKKRRRPGVRPDIDNYLKGVLDAGNGIVWKDDGQLVDIQVSKYYTEQVGQPGRIELMVHCLGNDCEVVGRINSV